MFAERLSFFHVCGLFLFSLPKTVDRRLSSASVQKRSMLQLDPVAPAVSGVKAPLPAVSIADISISLKSCSADAMRSTPAIARKTMPSLLPRISWVGGRDTKFVDCFATFYLMRKKNKNDYSSQCRFILRLLIVLINKRYM